MLAFQLNPGIDTSGMEGLPNLGQFQPPFLAGTEPSGMDALGIFASGREASMMEVSLNPSGRVMSPHFRLAPPGIVTEPSACGIAPSGTGLPSGICAPSGIFMLAFQLNPGIDTSGTDGVLALMSNDASDVSPAVHQLRYACCPYHFPSAIMHCSQYVCVFILWNMLQVC